MRTQIGQHQSWVALIMALFVLAFSGGETHAQTDSSCSREGSSRSSQTSQAAKLTLANQTKETLTVYWLDFEGKRQKWFDLSAGQAFEQSTFVGHLWLVTKPNGQCLAIFSAPGNFVIGKPQTPVNTNRPQQSQNQTTVQPISDAAIEKSWTEFFTAFQRAVKQRDKAALKKMISSNWEIMDTGKLTPDDAVGLLDTPDRRALEKSLASGIVITKVKTRRITADCRQHFDLEADGKWRWLYACFDESCDEEDCPKPTIPVNNSRPTQSQNQTTAQPNTSASGRAQTGNAVLTVSSQPGAANPLAGAGLALFKQSFGEDLRRKGQVPAGSSAKLTPLEFWARSCLTAAGNCRQAMTEMRANSVTDTTLDANGKATLPAVPPGAYYVYVIARAVPPRAWEQSVELKPGANSVMLDPRNMASLDTILSGNKPPSDVAAKPPSPNNPTTNSPPGKLTDSSTDADAYVAQGNKYLDAKQYAKAVEAYKKAIALQPSVGAYNGLGLAYDGLEQYPNEVAAFQQAVRLKPDSASLRYNLAAAYMYTEQFEESMGALRESLRLKPNDANATYLLGITYVEMGRKEEALQVLKNVQRLNPAMAKKLAEEIDLIEGTDPNALLNLGLDLRLKPQQYTYAMRLFRRVIVMNKDPETVAEAYWWMGDLYSQKDQGAKATAAYQQAAVFYQQALRAKPNDAVLLSKLCYNYIVLGRKQEAQQIYGRLQRVDREKAQKLSEAINKMK